MTDNDDLIRRINNKLRGKVFRYGLLYLLHPDAMQKENKSYFKSPHLSKFIHLSFLGELEQVVWGEQTFEDLSTPVSSRPMMMQCHPFKGMTITLVPLLLIPPPDPCHQRSTRLSLNVLHLLARAAGSFHVCEEPDEYA